MKYIVFLAFVALASAAVQTDDVAAQIVSQDQDVGFDGTFHSSWESSNGIKVSEQGVLKNAGPDGAAEVQGSAQWTAPDGTPVSIQWVANENGYQPQGSHIPVPPPVPAAIVRALEWIAAHPQKEELIRKL